MKILLVTITDNNNIGTYLQIYATVKKIEERGHDVVLLDYIRDYLYDKEYALNLWKDKNIVMRYLFAWYYSYKNRNIKFNTKSFLHRMGIKMTKPYHSISEIKADRLIYDMYMVGSDQVWNYKHNFNRVDEVYFLSFANSKKVSYASSIGVDSFPPAYSHSIKQYLSDFEYISVRENSAVDLLSEIGIRDVYHVLDPTMLITKTEWKEHFCWNNEKINEKYLLIYSVEEGNESLVYSIARRIAEEQNLKIYQITSNSNFKFASQVDHFWVNVTPEMFIYLFYRADFLIVSSFHGTAFAINFNKNFVTIAPKHFDSRVKSLLEKYNLQSYYCDDNSTFSFMNIDYDPVNKILAKQRKDSEKYLDTILK